MLFNRESNYHSKLIKTGLLAFPASNTFPSRCVGTVVIRLEATICRGRIGITVARQPMIYTWFPIKPFLGYLN
jgi:hypothetical protein